MSFQYNYNFTLMKNITNYVYPVSFSKYTFTKKVPKGEFKGYMNWLSRDKVTPKLHCQRIKEGKAFVGIFEKNHRCNACFSCAWHVPVDIDDSYGVDMYSYIDSLSLKPTFAYTTWSNNKDNGPDGQPLYKFRLVYVFDEPVTDIYNYQVLSEKVELSLGKDIKDKCGRRASQLMYPNPEAEFYTPDPTKETDVIYSFSDFDFEPIESPFQLDAGTEIDSKIKECIHPELLKDLRNMDYPTFLNAYKHHKIVEHSEIKYNEYGYTILPDDFIELQHRWHMVNGERKPRIRRNGEKRRWNLLFSAYRIKKVAKDISQEALCYNIVYQMYHYYDFTDSREPITHRDIERILYQAWNTNVNDPVLSQMLTSNRCGRYTTDKEFCKANGLDRKTYWRTCRKEDAYTWIDSWYQKDKSVPYNYEHQPKEYSGYYHGKPVSHGTLKNYCKARVLHIGRLP